VTEIHEGMPPHFVPKSKLRGSICLPVFGPVGEAVKELDTLLAGTIRIRLMSEVPLGVFKRSHLF